MPTLLPNWWGGNRVVYDKVRVQSGALMHGKERWGCLHTDPQEIGNSTFQMVVSFTRAEAYILKYFYSKKW